MANFITPDKSWSLFLDRDGVINRDKEGGYILKTDEFVLLDGVTDAIKIFSGIFGVIVVVTNQKGVGKGLMSIKDLDAIHHLMLEEIKQAAGRIDKIYYSTDLDNNSPNRKPQPGMAWQAKKDFPAIDFSKSIMVGNRIGDMEFGRNAGMYTVFLTTTHPETPFPNPLIDARFDSLISFAGSLQPQ